MQKYNMQYNYGRMVANLKYLLLILFVYSCGNENTNEHKLYEIDNLIELSHNDSANVLLDKYIVSEEATAEEKAIYQLLKTKLAYRRYIPLTSDTVLDASIRYFSKHNNLNYLAQCYYYKGCIEFKLQKHKSAIVNLKRAEDVAQDVEDVNVKYKIYGMLSDCNNIYKEYKLAIVYAYKARYVAIKAKNTYWEAYANVFLSQNYLELNQTDSAVYYLQKCIPCLNSVPRKERLSFYAYILQKMPKMKLKEISASLSDGENEVNDPAWENVKGNVAFENGDYSLAEKLWKKTAHDERKEDCLDALDGLVRLYRAQGNIKKALDVSEKMQNLKDSFASVRQENNILLIQKQFDTQLASEKKWGKTKLLLCLFGTIIVAIVVIIYLYVKYTREKEKKEIHKLQLQLLATEEHLRKLQSVDSNQKSDIIALKKETRQLREVIAHKLPRGKRRYDEICDGSNVSVWSERDMESFVEYYKMFDAQYVLGLEVDCDNLTLQNRVLLILYKMGKTDEEVAQILGKTKGAVRTMKSRIMTKLKKR